MQHSGNCTLSETQRLGTVTSVQTDLCAVPHSHATRTISPVNVTRTDTEIPQLNRG